MDLFKAGGSDDSSSRSPDTTEPQLSQRIWLEVGHTYERRYWKSGRAVPEDWRVWVRGVAGADITPLIDKVVFQLIPDTQFPFPKRIILESPFELEEAGSAPMEIKIDVHFKCSKKTEKFQLNYGPMFVKAEDSYADSRCVFYDVQHPTKELVLMKTPSPASGGVLIVLPDSGEPRPRPRTQPAVAAGNHANQLPPQKKLKIQNGPKDDNFNMILTPSNSGRRCHRCRALARQCPSCRAHRAR